MSVMIDAYVQPLISKHLQPSLSQCGGGVLGQGGWNVHRLRCCCEKSCCGGATPPGPLARPSSAPQNAGACDDTAHCSLPSCTHVRTTARTRTHTHIHTPNTPHALMFIAHLCTYPYACMRSSLHPAPPPSLHALATTPQAMGVPTCGDDLPTPSNMTSVSEHAPVITVHAVTAGFRT